EVGENRKSRRETIETTVLPKSVLDAYVMTGAVAQMQEEEYKVFSTETQVMVLYLGEDNQIYEASMRVPVEEKIVMDAEKTCSCRAACPGEVFATPTPGGLEVRYPVDFSFQTLTELKMAGISAVTLEEGEKIERPSMVVRMTEAGDRIWDLAKQYASTMEDICAANALEDQDSELPVGRLLLIPHKR
ncbi:MAG: LysM peptidoglycan-binding domain-containing protein, partial [Oscillospiraceae bacterium]|nr:LysM peptidoglycan-binding domain-containing protein [Oscillospiraceae bacterium]